VKEQMSNNWERILCVTNVLKVIAKTFPILLLLFGPCLHIMQNYRNKPLMEPWISNLHVYVSKFYFYFQWPSRRLCSAKQASTTDKSCCTALNWRKLQITNFKSERKIALGNGSPVTLSKNMTLTSDANSFLSFQHEFHFVLSVINAVNKLH